MAMPKLKPKYGTAMPVPVPAPKVYNIPSWVPDYISGANSNVGLRYNPRTPLRREPLQFKQPPRLDIQDIKNAIKARNARKLARAISRFKGNLPFWLGEMLLNEMGIQIPNVFGMAFSTNPMGWTRTLCDSRGAAGTALREASLSCPNVNQVCCWTPPTEPFSPPTAASNTLMTFKHNTGQTWFKGYRFNRNGSSLPYHQSYFHALSQHKAFPFIQPATVSVNDPFTMPMAQPVHAPAPFPRLAPRPVRRYNQRFRDAHNPVPRTNSALRPPSSVLAPISVAAPRPPGLTPTPPRPVVPTDPPVVVGGASLPPHVLVPPTEGVKEQKNGMRLPAPVARVVGLITEMSDWIEAAYEALPCERRKRPAVGFGAKAKVVYRHWNEVNPAQFVANAILMQAEDKLIGEAAQVEMKGRRRTFKQTGKDIPLSNSRKTKYSQRALLQAGRHIAKKEAELHSAKEENKTPC